MAEWRVLQLADEPSLRSGEEEEEEEEEEHHKEAFRRCFARVAALSRTRLRVDKSAVQVWCAWEDGR